MAERDLNRIKLVLVEQKRTAKWLAGELHKDPATVSKWCTNTAQPSLETMFEIAKALNVDVKELINSSTDDTLYIKVAKPSRHLKYAVMRYSIVYNNEDIALLS